MIFMRAGRAAFTLALAALLLCPAPAAAQRSRGDADRNSPAAIRALHDYARCVAHDHWSRGRARALLAMDYRTDTAREALRSFIAAQRMCVAPYHALSSNSLLFAGALAEGLLPRNRDLAGLVAYDPARPPFQARDEREVMSLCVVRADPVAVAGLLATAPASAEEGTALRAIAPRLGQCLRAGARTQVNGLQVRALLALAAWRLSALNGGESGEAGSGGPRANP